MKNNLINCRNLTRLFLLAISCSLTVSVSAKQIELKPNFDALSSLNVDAKVEGKIRAALELDPRIKPDTIVRWHNQLNLPTFLWANTSVNLTKGRSSSELAKHYLTDYADIYRLDKKTLSGAEVDSVRTYNQATIVNFKQSYYGIEVFRQEMSLLLNQQNQLVALSGHLSPHIAEIAKKKRKLHFRLSNLEAAQAAFFDLSGQKQPLDLVKVRNSGGYDYLDSKNQIEKYRLLKDVRVKTVLYSHLDKIIPAFYVEIMAGEQKQKIPDSFSYVISANDGSVLLRNNLTSGASYDYRVHADTNATHQMIFDSPYGKALNPHPTCQPDESVPEDFVGQNLISIDHGPISTGDPWLPDGAVETVGNNVDAFHNVIEWDDDLGYWDIDYTYDPSKGDFRASITSENTFDYPLDPTIEAFKLADPSSVEPPNYDAQRNANIVNGFVVLNYLHDYFYDYGFDEQGGNFQMSNYGRGGIEGDPALIILNDFATFARVGSRI